MSTKLVLLKSSEEKELLAAHCKGIYLDGECYAFAIMLHRSLGWPIIGLVQSDGIIRHAVVKTPDGNYFDSRGKVTEESVALPFSNLSNYRVTNVVESDLFAIRPAEEASVSYARKCAEALWPELPWTDGLLARTKAFADALEALSREHGLWIRSAYETVAPHIALGDDEEGGYVVTEIGEGLGYTITRYFK